MIWLSLEGRKNPRPIGPRNRRVMFEMQGPVGVDLAPMGERRRPVGWPGGASEESLLSAPYARTQSPGIST